MANVKKINLIPVDIGAGSGRVLLATFDSNNISSREVYRFNNNQILLGGTLYWNFLNIMGKLQCGFRKASVKAEGKITSLGIDTWGADFGLLDIYDNLISNPVSYRDKRTKGIDEYIYKIISEDKLYELNSSKTYNYCTLFQLYHLYKFRNEIVKVINIFLPMPNLINFFLTGEKSVDPSILSGSQFYDVKRGEYRRDILARLGISDKILPEIIDSGTIIGDVRKEFSDVFCFTEKVRVTLVCSHDSASAVTGIPIDQNKTNSCYINSGTWSVVGLESGAPILSKEVKKSDFTNWRGFRDRNIFVKIFNGFYFIQECKKVWELEDGKEMDYEYLYKDTKYSMMSEALVDLDSSFLFEQDKNMPEKIMDYFNITSQDIEYSRVNIIVSLLQSMIIEYKRAIEELEKLSKVSFDRIYIVGGGSRNKIFCHWIADCLGKEVYTGYPESTINGNIITQLYALGEISSLEEGRDIIRNSHREKIYYPNKSPYIDWEKLKAKYLNLKDRQ